MLDPGMIYPVSYVNNGQYSGSLVEVYNVFEKLTGKKIAIIGASSSVHSYVDALNGIENGEYQAVAGVYYNEIQGSKGQYSYSDMLALDYLSFYTLQGKEFGDSTKMTFGCTKFNGFYVDWMTVTGHLPVVYDTTAELVDAVKTGEIDAALLGEMNVDYYYSIKNDYSLARYATLAVPASINLLYSSKNTNFNKLMDVSVVLREHLRVAGTGTVFNSRNDKFELLYTRDSAVQQQRTYFLFTIFFILALLALTAILLNQMRRRATYDKQIRRLFSLQKNVDLITGDARKGTLVSMSGYSILRTWGMNDEEIKNRNQLQRLRGDLAILEAEQKPYGVFDASYQSPDGKTYYLKRYTHRLGNGKFMAFIIDVTQETLRENELVALAGTDFLSEIFNRRAMDIFLSEQAAKPRVEGVERFIFMIDLDDFKHVNDTYGHDIGDYVLILAAQTIKAAIGAVGTVARWGGEEFVIYVEAPDLDSAKKIATNILTDFAGREIKISAGKSFYVTMSLGIAVWTENEHYTTAVTRSDNAMYQAKINGKNRYAYNDKENEIIVQHPYYLKASSASGVIGDSSASQQIYSKVMSMVVHTFLYGSDFGAIIEELLKIVSIYTGVERAYLLTMRADGTFIAEQIYDPEATSTMKTTVLQRDDVFALFDGELSSPRFVSDTTSTPGLEKSVKAFVTLPLTVDGRLYGCVLFESLAGAHNWSINERRLFSDVSGIIDEVVARKKLQTQLVLSNETLMAILDSVDDTIYVVNPHTHELLFVNNNFKTKFNVDSIVGKKCYDFINPGVGSICPFCRIDEVFGPDSTGTLTRYSKYHEVEGKWYDIVNTRIAWEENVDAAVVVMRDITAQKNEGEVLKTMIDGLESLKKLNDYSLESASGFTWELNTATNTMRFSDTVEAVLGYEARYLNGDYMKFFSMFDESYKGLALEKMLQGVRNTSSEFSLEHRIRTANGTLKWLFTRGRYIDADRIVLAGVAIDITERRTLEIHQRKLVDSLQLQRRNYEYVLANAKGFSWQLDAATGTLTFTSPVDHIFTFGSGHVPPSEYLGLWAEDDKERLFKAIDDYRNNITSTFVLEHRLILGDSQSVWLMSQGTFTDAAQKHIAGVSFDITAQKDVEAKLAEHVQSTQFALDGAQSFTWVQNFAQDTIDISEKQFESILGYKAGEFEGRMSMIDSLIPPQYRELMVEAQQAYFNGKTEVYKVEYPVRAANGETRWLLSRGRFRANSSDILYGVCIDITDKKRYEQRLQDIAFKDQLTGLFNLQYIMDGHIYENAQHDKLYSGFLLDINSFKNINDAYGYSFGDKLISNLADRLLKYVADKTIVRVAGNRFLVLLEHQQVSMLVALVSKLLSKLRKPFNIDTQKIVLDYNFGIVSAAYTDVDKLLSDAEIALYHSKHSEEPYCVLNDAMKRASERRAILEQELRKAVGTNQFVLYYQPKVGVKSKKIEGAEALIRWMHPELGIIPPVDFIKLAEENGTIVPIGEFVIDAAAAQLGAWLKEGKNLFMSLNVSPKQFLSPSLPAKLIAAINKYGIPKDKLLIEITETIMVSDFAHIANILKELAEAGIGVALDDFGTGYSSMSYLSHIDIDKLKIDKSFIDVAKVDTVEGAIVESIINMAHRLGMEVIAEGVETRDQFDMLEQYACDYIQGFYFSRPLPSDGFAGFYGSYEWKKHSKNAKDNKG